MLYCKTIDPEYVDSIIYLEDYCYEGSDYIIDGGKEWKSFNTDLLDMVKKAIDNYYELEYGYAFDHSIKEYADWYLPRKDGKAYTPMQLHKIREYLEKEDVLSLLSIVSGKTYKLFGLRGCCQGDYVKLYAPEDTELDYVEEIEAVYFNTGTEVLVDDTERKYVDNPLDICGYTFYTKYYNAKDIKHVICANYKDLKPQDIKLWTFAGYTQTAKYNLE